MYLCVVVKRQPTILYTLPDYKYVDRRLRRTGRGVQVQLLRMVTLMTYQTCVSNECFDSTLNATRVGVRWEVSKRQMCATQQLGVEDAVGPLVLSLPG